MKAKEIIRKVLFAVGLFVVGSGMLESVVLKLMDVLGL